MNKALFPLLLCLLFLWGCAAQNPQTESTEPPRASAAATEALPVQDALQMELLCRDDAVRQYVFSQDVAGFLPLRENFLLFSGTEPTVLTLVDPVSLEVLAVHKPSFVLTAENVTVQLLDQGISYFNSTTGETVVLDDTLREVRRIQVPEDLHGMPLLSGDGSTLYYCTGSAVRALDLTSGISRVLKEAAYPVQGLSGLLLADSVLQISITDHDEQWRTLFLSSENGRLLTEAPGNILPEADTEHYLLQTNGSIFFGTQDGSPMLLHPRQADVDCYLLPGTYQAVTAAVSEGSTILELYDLSTGSRQAEVSLPGTFVPKNVTLDAAGRIWFLTLDGTPTLSCWDPGLSTVTDSTCYCGPYYTREEPDYEGLAACALYAEELGAKYGIEVLIYRDAVAVEPWDYHLDYEYQASILQRELEALDHRLGHFPDGFIQTLRDTFTALKICIVRHAEGSPESGSLEAVNGIQFMQDFDAYIVLATDHDTEYALYHELSHLMETVVLTESVAYDRWDNLNPEDFRYDNDYIANQTRDGSPWMKPGREYFIDTYSMSYAKEDRARLFEYAMTAGHEALFASPNLQHKLQQLCTGIREGFGLKKYDGTLPWEQYLQQ